MAPLTEAAHLFCQRSLQLALHGTCTNRHRAISAGYCQFGGDGMAQESQVSYKQSKPLSKNDFERIQKLLAEMEERQEKISIVPLTKDSTRRKLSRSSGSSGVVNWADKVRAAITNLEAKNGRVLEPERALALIDDIVEGKLAADELAMIHGIPPEWIRTTLGLITR